MDIKKDVISAFKKIAENSEEIECKILWENLLEMQATAVVAYSDNLTAKISTIRQLKINGYLTLCGHVSANSCSSFFAVVDVCQHIAAHVYLL